MREVSGVLGSAPAGGAPGDWVVGGRVVHVTMATVVSLEHGGAVAGAFVEAKGTLRVDGSLDAVRVEVLWSPQAPTGEVEAELKGAVEALPAGGGAGSWTVAGRTVTVTASTRIEQEHGAIAQGSFVEVKGSADASGVITATKIEVVWGPATAGTAQTSRWMIPASASTGRFTSNLVVSNTGSTAASVRVKFLGHDRDGRTGPEVELHVEAEHTLKVEDHLRTLFGAGDDFGAVLVTSNVPALTVSAETEAHGESGAFGSGHQAHEARDLVGHERPRDIAGVKKDDRTRTNLLLASATESPMDVDVILVGSDGVERGRERVHLEPLEMKQLNDAPGRLGEAGPIDGARIRLLVATPGAALSANATVIDNGTNDARILSPR